MTLAPIPTYAWVVPALPFVAAFLGLAAGRRFPGLIRPLAVLPTLAATALASWVAVAQGTGGVTERVARLLPVGPLEAYVGTRVDPLAATVGVMVCVVALLVQIYSSGYMASDPRYSSYAALVSLFTAAMLLVVYSADLIALLVGWEVMGICSYFLIGHHWETPGAQAAAVKAFVMTKLGDVPFLFGIFVLGLDAGSFRIGDVLAAAGAGQLEHAQAAALLLLGGVVGKSAQFPLHSWLPDAMAGPTPISALIHAATMVAAGVYLVARLYPVYLAAPVALAVLAVVAAVTMLGAALAALAQDDIKRVLAYSTVSQLAYMAGGLAVGAREASMFHLLAHAAFKALLFLAAGTVIHALGTNLMGEMGGLRRHMKTTFWTMTIGLAALAGLPPFAGFFSKEAILGAAEHAARHGGPVAAWAAWAVLVAGLVTVAVTAAYVTRLWLRTFFGRPAIERVAYEVPAVMAWPLVALAIPSALLGFLALRPDWLPARVGGDAALVPSSMTSALALLAASVGLLATHWVWRRDPAADPARVLGPLRRPCERAFSVDGLYEFLFVAPYRALVRLVRFTDDEVVDAYVRGSGVLARLAGAGLRLTQTGNVQTYLTGLLAGVVLIAISVVMAQ
ncbi:NADH-quinone oxidoreductase subunit 5 family protein [Carbonactinospora thermoautotrophica]|uniref:NADH-quinone oxidoreductase subunit 5 family protein n=1 Tax=Carbonactinospora thermoautotrophica TaxID=1469144 RepID=UPI003DA9CC65